MPQIEVPSVSNAQAADLSEDVGAAIYRHLASHRDLDLDENDFITACDAAAEAIVKKIFIRLRPDLVPKE